MARFELELTMISMSSTFATKPQGSTPTQSCILIYIYTHTHTQRRCVWGHKKFSSSGSNELHSFSFSHPSRVCCTFLSFSVTILCTFEGTILGYHSALSIWDILWVFMPTKLVLLMNPLSFGEKSHGVRLDELEGCFSSVIFLKGRNCRMPREFWVSALSWWSTCDLSCHNSLFSNTEGSIHHMIYLKTYLLIF